MNTYVTGTTIKQLREAKGMTQIELADKIGVSSKAVSKWETAKGLPDITLLEPLAKALSVSVMELMSGQAVCNKNVSCNMLRTKIYVCPVCGNIIHCAGESVISCCGILLPALEAEEPDDEHTISIEKVEDEHFITVQHDMTKSHYISFIAYATSDRFWLTKLYPEGNAETRFQFRGAGCLYIYCNKHGLMRQKIPFIQKWNR
ncbi:MAG: helix-turn-helix domain-containing protein [Ruminococcaceae bacterium]|nr:helix-turn-helix domain-containing protein [Oscillospiraceae bacterium]